MTGDANVCCQPSHYPGYHSSPAHVIWPGPAHTQPWLVEEAFFLSNMLHFLSTIFQVFLLVTHCCLLHPTPAHLVMKAAHDSLLSTSQVSIYCIISRDISYLLHNLKKNTLTLTRWTIYGPMGNLLVLSILAQKAWFAI